MRKKAIELTTTWNKDLEIGAAIEGVYLKKEVFDGKYGTTEKYVIESNGEKYGVFSSASLANQFKNIPEGSYVWITYKGEETSKNGRPVKVYEVEYDDEYRK
jgi:hypothetical protein